MKGAPLAPAAAAGRRMQQDTMIRALQEKKRLQPDESWEARRQVRDLAVHNWLKKHSIKAVART